jgi:hypothetical protein
MPLAIKLHRLATRHLQSLDHKNASRLVLSLYFKAVLGIERIFHFDTINDKGFAILTGGKKVLSRSTLGGLLRAAPVQGVLRLVQASKPTMTAHDQTTVSIDEHTIPRFTKKFSIRKGFHTIRNKHMKAEKLFYPFLIGSRKLLALIVTRGHANLATIAARLLPTLRRQARGRQLRILLDAGAAHHHQRLLALADHDNQVTIVRTPRKKAYRKHWECIPKSDWHSFQDNGPFTDAPMKTIHVAETKTWLGPRAPKKNTRSALVRTIVVREERGRGKERWHALWVFNDDKASSIELVHEFRTRQHHEQTYRIMLHDIFVDAAPSGYDKLSPNVKRPGFKQNALTLYSWLAALAANDLCALTQLLPKKFFRAHPRTLRRFLLNVDAELYQSRDTLIVSLHPRKLLPLWEHLVRSINDRSVRVPWLNNRRLIMALATTNANPSPENSFDPTKCPPGVWC